jgi:site-specific DNA-methyltransferase (adenine-specific)
MTLINTGCGLAGMRTLAPGSVDLVFCDLPSGETRAHFDNPIDLAEFWAAAWPTLKPNGVVVLMASSLRYAAQVIASEPKWYRYDVVWEKGRPTGFLNVKRMPLRTHEFLLVFYRSLPTYNPQTTPGERRVRARTAPNSANFGSMAASRHESDERQPRSVVRFDNNYARRHPQQKPIPLLQWIVRTYTNEGDLVVDPCAGSGSCGVAALGVRREFIGWDFEPKPPSAVDVGLFG